MKSLYYLIFTISYYDANYHLMLIIIYLIHRQI